MMKKNITIIFLLSAVHLFADNPKISDNNRFPFNYGRMEDTVYTNPFFGFKLAIPSTWIVQNKTQIDYVLSKSKDVLDFDNELMNKAVEKLDVNSMTLLMVYKYEIGAPVKYNPSIIILAESMLMQPGIKTGDDYLYHVSSGLKQSNLNYECNPSENKFTYDDFTFSVLDCSIIQTIVYQKYYSSVIKRYAFSFIITFSDDEERDELINIINTAEFVK